MATGTNGTSDVCPISTTRLVLRTLGWFALILVVEAVGLAIAVFSGGFASFRSPPFTLGLAMAFCMLPWGAYRLARYTRTTAGPIAYGVVGSLVYVPLMILAYQDIGGDDPSLNAIWLGAGAGMAGIYGLLCWGAAELRRGGDAGLAEAAQSRMGINHLLLWTTCTAVYLAVERAGARFRGSFPGEEGLRYQAIMSLRALGAGGAVMGGVLFVARRFRRLAFPRHPGEYLLLAMALECIVALASSSFLPRSLYGPSALLYFSLQDVLRLLGSLILLIPAWRKTTPPLWRVYFGLSIAANLGSSSVLSHFAGAWSVYAYAGIALLPSVLLVAIVLRGWRTRHCYPWTHWFGAGMALWGALCTIIWLVAYSLGAF
ncbi:MAG: hypothetical protein ABR915_07590 [Thermoguttaceae bacterium]|jgi:hypothetical protein